MVLNKIIDIQLKYQYAISEWKINMCFKKPTPGSLNDAIKWY